jgi:hypothetical protein
MVPSRLFLSTAMTIGLAACPSLDGLSGSGGQRAPTPVDDGGSLDAGSVDGSGVTAPDGSDSSIELDAAEPAPTFEITRVASISGTFVTDKTASDGVPTNATVTWKFTIDAIGDATLASTTARWNAQAVAISGGNASDFPPDTNISLSLTRTSATADPRTGTWEFYAFQASPHVYILVKVDAGRIIETYYYRRQVEDTETNPPDKPRNVTYSTTSK